MASLPGDAQAFTMADCRVGIRRAGGEGQRGEHMSGTLGYGAAYRPRKVGVGMLAGATEGQKEDESSERGRKGWGRGPLGGG